MTAYAAVVADGADCPCVRRAAITAHLAPEQGLGNGRTEKSLRVSARLVGGHVAVQQGTSSDWTYVPVEKAKTITVER